MNGTVLRTIDCPYCGEPVELAIDTSVEHQDYIEDCSVCCRPIVLSVDVVGDEVLVAARDENET
jgi:hypothetical protein